MKIYFIGIKGTGLKPLAEFAREAGMEVAGSDREERVGDFAVAEADWVVYSSAIPATDIELMKAKAAGKRMSKRHELINELMEKLGLKMLAVAGSHGKTTTVSMLAWACHKTGQKVSYLVGSDLPWEEGKSGHYEAGSEWLIYEADEYDRNFLNFRPAVAGITTVSYDHPDIYETEADYVEAFRQFREQSEVVVENVPVDEGLTLAGELRRYDASLAMAMLRLAYPEVTRDAWVAALNSFPSPARRFEEIASCVVTDYAHHPEEVAATMKMAKEVAAVRGLQGVVALYEPHQNARQVQMIDDYAEAFSGAAQVLWLPTYLTREKAGQRVIPAEEFVERIKGVPAEAVEMDDKLARRLWKMRQDGYLILLMSAGPADGWYRKAWRV
ncbi:Mur ligase domain-containing protein [Candidatus Saccharibacteria bacterium]|nr:Mur ligase domain-containing protein [Candidatus Saccharibacteria bacterium]